MQRLVERPLVETRAPERTFAPVADLALARLLDAAPDAMVLLDGAANLLWGNQAAEQLFGRSMASSVGLSGLEFVHPDDVELAALSLGTVQDKTVGTPIEVRVRSAEGWRLVEVIGTPVGAVVEGAVLLCLRDLTERRRWEVAVDETELFRTLIHNSPTITLLADRDGTVRAASGALTRLLGHDPEDVLGSNLLAWVEADDHHRLRSAFEDAAAGRRGRLPVSVDARFVRRNAAAPLPLDLTIVNLLDDPTVEGLVVSATDATQRTQAEDELRDALSLLNATLDSTADGVVVVDRDLRITSFNRRFAEMWRLPDDVLLTRDGERAVEYVLDQLRDPEGFVAKIDELMSKPTAESHDTIEFKDGRVLERYSQPQRVAGDIVGRVWSFHDVTLRRRLEEELSQQALHDSLTGLANQALFRDRVEHALLRGTRSGRRVAVLFMDLDGFKRVNDSLGHAAGDRLLVTVAQRLRSCLRSADTAARLGGDEFAVLLEDIDAEEEATTIADRVATALRPPISVDGTEVVASFSIGIALGDTRVDREQLLRNADLAMYTAKGSGGDGYALFEEDMHAAAMERLELETDLRHATERGELVVLYQPIVDLRTGLVVGVEALARWRHPRRGLLNPAAFIPLAEETGLIEQVGHRVLLTATAQVAAWNAELAPDRRMDVSVNLSPRQLLHPDLPEQIASAIADSGLRPEELVVEITEGAMVRDADTAAKNAAAVHDMGVRLAVDDFGTGYSSLTHLQRFPIDIVKIDRSFVYGVAGDAEDAALARAIVRLAHTLRLDAIAEGVETPAQAQRLRTIGCNLAQGFYFAAPLTAVELVQMLDRGPVAHAGALYVARG